MTNLQDFVPGHGELRLGKNTWESIELYVEHYVPELDQVLKFPLEEDVYWDARTEAFEWVYGRQERFHIVDPNPQDWDVALRYEMSDW